VINLSNSIGLGMADPNGSTLFHGLSDEWACLIGAFVGGFVDAAGYIKLQGLFTSSITGNLCVAVTSVVMMTGVIARSCVCISFILGAWLAGSVSLRVRMFHGLHVRLAASIMFSMELALLVVTLIVGVLLDGRINASKNLDDWEVVLLGSLLGASMGIHALTIKDCIANSPSTTVMTMTMVTFGSQLSSTVEYFFASQGMLQLSTKPLSLDLAERASSLKALESKYIEFRNKLWVTAKPLLSFTIGAILGAIIMYHGTFFSLFVPIFFISLYIVLIIIKGVEEKKKAIDIASSATKDIVSYKALPSDIEMAVQMQESNALSVSARLAEETNTDTHIITSPRNDVEEEKVLTSKLCHQLFF